MFIKQNLESRKKESKESYTLFLFFREPHMHYKCFDEFSFTIIFFLLGRLYVAVVSKMHSASFC